MNRQHLTERAVGGIELTSKQSTRLRRIERAIADAGLEGEEAIAARADEVWITLYEKTRGKWVRREIATTSRGFSFAQRPDE